jgi:hypothetical protein
MVMMMMMMTTITITTKTTQSSLWTKTCTDSKLASYTGNTLLGYDTETL